MSYYVMNGFMTIGFMSFRTEYNMRFNSNRTNQRSDFEDFTRFLGMNGQRTHTNSNLVQNSSRSVANNTHSNQNGCVSGAKCDVDSANRYGTQNRRSLAMVYAEKQSFESIFDPEVALINGTMFEELYKPFQRGSCRGRNDNGEGCF